MKKKLFRKRLLSALTAGLLMMSTFTGSLTSLAANVEETPDLQLQTILVDNDGTNSWITESWGGALMTPNTSWTTLSIQDYYANGYIHFKVRCTEDTTDTFFISLTSRVHGETSEIIWNNIEGQQNYTATSEWSSYTLSIKEWVDAFPDSDFSLENLLYIKGRRVSGTSPLEFQDVTISSTDDERQYPIIKVNQVGYYCTGSKSARISYFAKFGSLNGKTYEIVNRETEEVVLTGQLPDAVENDTLSGESVHIITFDELTTPGTYYIRIPDADLDASARSPRDVEDGLETETITSVSFSIASDVYDGLLTDMTKYFYYQRQGIDLEEEYAGVFARENLHPGDSTVKKWSDRNDDDAETYDVSGGWYDAGDYGKYTIPAAEAVSDLLFAYELYPEAFENIDPNIPETDPDNELYVDAPAILSEVKWELDMLMKLEHSSKDGSFYVAANYNNGTIYLEDTLYDTSDSLTSDSSETDLRSHESTACAAAVFAHAYIVYRDIPAYADFAETCLETSLRAWDWITDSSNERHLSIDAANRTYTFKEEELDWYQFWAAGSIYRALTLKGEDASEYENYIIDNCNTENNTYCFRGMSVSYRHYGESFLGYFQYLYKNENANETVKNVFSKFDSWRTTTLKNDSWGTTIPEWGFWWGSNKNITQNTMTLVMGSIILEGEDSIPEEVLDVVTNTENYMLGVNPISFCYVSGEGENGVENIFSNIYSVLKKLDPYQIPAGYVTEGSNDNNNPHISKFTGKCYLDSDGEWTTNENTIYGNAAMIFLTASVIAQQKSQQVRGDVNLDGEFNIADLVMMQEWLLNSGSITSWENGDMDSSQTLDSFDLCLMRQELCAED